MTVTTTQLRQLRLSQPSRPLKEAYAQMDRMHAALQKVSGREQSGAPSVSGAAKISPLSRRK